MAGKSSMQVFRTWPRGLLRTALAAREESLASLKAGGLDANVVRAAQKQEVADCALDDAQPFPRHKSWSSPLLVPVPHVECDPFWPGALPVPFPDFC